jgi:hypothetical protein
MDFATTDAASQFIKLVSTVCPCTTTDRVPRANRCRPQATLTSAPSSRPHPMPKKAQHPAPTQPKKMASIQSRQTGPSSVISAGSDDSHTLPSESSDPLLEALPVRSGLGPQLTFDQTYSSSFVPPPTPSQHDISSQSAIPRFFPPSQPFLPGTPIPSSSQMLPPTVPVTPQPALQPSTQPNAFIESLMHSPTIYGLSKPQLEAVVAQVIREEGFVKLVRVYFQRSRVFWSSTFFMHLARNPGLDVEGEGFRPEFEFLGHGISPYIDATTHSLRAQTPL